MEFPVAYSQSAKMEVSRREKKTLLITMLLLLSLALISCEEEQNGNATTPSVVANRYLYVASGTCYSGNGLTSFSNVTASNLLFRVKMSTSTATATKDATIADYYASPSNVGDSPVAIVSENSSSLLVLVENTTTVGLRRIERVAKASGGARSTYSGNITALSAQLRAMTQTSDGYLLVSKSSAVEKMRDGSNRLLVGANPWVNLATPVSSCTTSTTLIPAVTKLNNGSIVFAHASAGQARVGVVNSLGYSVAGDCKAAQSSPNANAFPTAMVYDGTNNKLIVAYGGSSTGADLNSIYAYSINESTGAISNAQKIYDSSLFGSSYNYLLFGISAMAFDSTTNELYVATAVSTGTTVSNYRIERLRYDASQIGVTNTNVLTKVGTFYDFGNDTKCISSMTIAD